MNKKTSIMLMMVSFSLVACGGNDTPQASESSVKPLVIDGTPSKSGDRPYQVGLFNNPDVSKKEYYCGGTIISKKWILTAAHCVDGKEPANMLFYVGSLKRKGGEKILAKRSIIHPDYKGWRNDIALVELQKEIKFSDSVSAAALPTPAIDQKNTAPGSKHVMSGWGYISRNPVKLPSELREASLKVVSQEACQKSFPGNEKEIEEVICASSEGQTQTGCSGDSGGPFASKVDGKHFVFGTVSEVEDGTNCAGATLFERTSAFQAWITQVTGIQPVRPQAFMEINPIGSARTDYYPAAKQSLKHAGGQITLMFNTLNKSKYVVRLQQLNEAGQWITRETLQSKAPEHTLGKINGNYPAGSYRLEINTSKKGEGSSYQIIGQYNTQE